MLKDRDIVVAEPTLFSTNKSLSIELTGGTNGIVAGTQFTASGVDFTASQVVAGNILWLTSTDGSIDAGYEIVALIDSTHLSVSTLRADPADSPIPVGSASGLTWHILTYGARIFEAELQLSHRFRCLPGWVAETLTLDDLDNPAVVKQVLLYLFLAHIYGSLYGAAPAATTGGSTDPADLVWEAHKAKCTFYRKLTERVMRQL